MNGWLMFFGGLIVGGCSGFAAAYVMRFFHHLDTMKVDDDLPVTFSNPPWFID